MLIGGFAARHLATMTATELAWFEALLDEQDVDIMAWAFGRGEPPAHLASPMIERLRALDYIDLPGR
jgi:antitoxin CptB